MGVGGGYWENDLIRVLLVRGEESLKNVLGCRKYRLEEVRRNWGCVYWRIVEIRKVVREEVDFVGGLGRKVNLSNVGIE